MSNTDDLAEVIRRTASGPARASVEGSSVDAQDLDKLIAADKYLAEQAARAQGGLGIRLVKLRPPGAG